MSESNFKPLLELFMGISENADFKQAAEFYRAREFEYEKRSVSSLILGSAASLTVLISFSGNFENSDAFLANMLPTFFLLLVALFSSGVCQFLLNEASSLHFKRSTCETNHQNYSVELNKFDRITAAISVLEKIFPEIKLNDRSRSDQRFKLEDKKNQYNTQRVLFKDKAEKFDRAIGRGMIFSAIAFFLAILYPVSLIAFKGSLS